MSSFCCFATESCLVFLVILSVFFENSGFMKAGPRQSQFEPSEGKTVMFGDVHGVDEAKEVGRLKQESFKSFNWFHRSSKMSLLS